VDVPAWLLLAGLHCSMLTADGVTLAYPTDRGEPHWAPTGNVQRLDGAYLLGPDGWLPVLAGPYGGLMAWGRYWGGLHSIQYTDFVWTPATPPACTWDALPRGFSYRTLIPRV